MKKTSGNKSSSAKNTNSRKSSSNGTRSYNSKNNKTNKSKSTRNNSTNNSNRKSSGNRKKRNKNSNKMISAVCAVLFIPALIYGIWNYHGRNIQETTTQNSNIQLTDIPEYSGTAYIEVNNNLPYFKESEYSTEPFEIYSELDELGRCGVAYANICQELMPTEERGSIGSVKPSGWHTVKYPEVIKDLYLYNRCHLIGFQLAGENANKRNLITGTRYMNVDGMLPFEDMVAEYVKETDNHVLYRVTPVFEGENLVADGVLMEAYSVEDDGEGVTFCVFVYNIQPGIEINYLTGESKISEISE